MNVYWKQSSHGDQQTATIRGWLRLSVYYPIRRKDEIVSDDERYHIAINGKFAGKCASIDEGKASVVGKARKLLQAALADVSEPEVPSRCQLADCCLETVKVLWPTGEKSEKCVVNSTNHYLARTDEGVWWYLSDQVYKKGYRIPTVQLRNLERVKVYNQILEANK